MGRNPAGQFCGLVSLISPVVDIFVPLYAETFFFTSFHLQFTPNSLIANLHCGAWHPHGAKREEANGPSTMMPKCWYALGRRTVQFAAGPTFSRTPDAAQWRSSVLAFKSARGLLCQALGTIPSFFACCSSSASFIASFLSPRSSVRIYTSITLIGIAGCMMLMCN